MKRYHTIVHYRLSSTLMIIGIVVSFICYFNCMNLYHLLATHEKERVEYQYNSQISLHYLNTGLSFNFADSESGTERSVSDGRLEDQIPCSCAVGYLTSEKGIIRMQNILLLRDRAGAPGLTDILLCQNEALKYPVLEGSLPETDEDITEPTVILGRRQVEDAVLESGEYYYELEGVRCRVCAVLGSENSDLFDYNVILYYKGMNDTLHRVVDNVMGADLVIESDREQVQEILDGLQQRVEKQAEQIVLSVGNSEEVVIQGTSEDSSYYLVIFLFCFVNIVFVSEYWIRRRYREIAVRKIFGYSNWKLYGLLYRDMVVNVSIAVLIAGILQLFLRCVFDEYLILYKSQFGAYLGYSVLFVFFLSALLMIYPLRLMKKEDVLRQMISKCR